MKMHNKNECRNKIVRIINIPLVWRSLKNDNVVKNYNRMALVCACFV